LRLINFFLNLADSEINDLGPLVGDFLQGGTPPLGRDFFFIIGSEQGDFSIDLDFKDFELDVYKKKYLQKNIDFQKKYLTSLKKMSFRRKAQRLKEVFDQFEFYDGDESPVDFLTNFLVQNSDVENYLLIFEYQKKNLYDIWQKRIRELELESAYFTHAVAIGVYNLNNDLVDCNKAFQLLAPSKNDLFLFSDQSLIEIKKDNFHLVRTESSELIFFFITKASNIKPADYSFELGVVCSSLAHELNNPLGGILSCAQVLKDYSSVKNLDQIKILGELIKSTKKCHSLVSTFLDFASKKKSNIGPIINTIKEVISLFSTRFIELDLKVIPAFTGELDVQFKNPSSWSMILYLVLNDILNLYLRDGMIQGVKLNNLHIEFFIMDNRISLIGIENTEIDSNSFLEHLMFIVGAKITIEQNILSFDISSSY
jgi:hypothetical protein